MGKVGRCGFRGKLHKTGSDGSESGNRQSFAIRLNG